jgi:hypothetical protein
MKRTLVPALILLLVALIGCPVVNATKITRLRLERTTTPGGVWEHVPSETLPTAEGEFEDSFDADSAYYRMRVDVVDDQRPPASIPLQEVPVLARNLAQQHLEDNRDIEGDNAWQDAILAPVAFPMYNPAVQGIAYLEFKVIAPEDPQGPLGGPELPAPARRMENFGYILVSLTKNDLPIASYATEGLTRTEMLRKMAKTASVRIFKYDTVFMVAEGAQGQVVAYLGDWPLRYPESICDYIGQEFEHIVDEQGEQVPPNAPDLNAEPYESYAAFKQDYLNSDRMKRARQARREEAMLMWDVYEGIPEGNTFEVGIGKQITVLEGRKVERFIVGDPSLATIQILEQGLSITGKVAGGTVLHTLYDSPGDDTFYALIVTDEAPLSPDKPTGWGSWTTYYAGSWSDQRRYYQTWDGAAGCNTGCGPVAWAMLYGWFDYTGSASLISGGPAPLYNNSYVEDCVDAVNSYCGTYCVGSSAATNPWDMPDGYKWASIDRGESYSISTTYSIPCFPTTGCREKARNSIRDDDKPAIIGLWCTSAHYCVAYGYRYRYYTWLGITLSTERQFKCNLGWGGSSPSWEDASVWYGNDPNFW